MGAPLPLLISTPHSSHLVPRGILNQMLASGEPEAALILRLKRFSDRFTDRIYDIPEAAGTINAAVSRYVADLNRGRHDASDNGTIKLVDFDLVPFYPPGHRIDPAEAERRLRLHYDPYHAELAAWLARDDIAFFIDGHSMGGARKMAPDPGQPRPAFCLANLGDERGEPRRGRTSCPPGQAREIKAAIEEIFRDLLAERRPDQRVTLNRPYNGGFILDRYSDPASPAWKPGVMIEVSKSLYVDDETLDEIPGRVAALNRGMRTLASVIVGMAGSRR